MRLVILLVFAALCSGVIGQGFFSGLMNAVNRFNPFRPSRRPRPSTNNQRPFSSNPRPSQSSFSSPPSPSFNPANNPPAPSFSSSSSSSSSFNNPPPPSSSSFSSRPVSSPPSSNQISNFGSSSSGGSGRGNHRWNGGDYLLSWLEGQNSLSFSQARSYCAGRGMRMLSMDNSAKVEHFLNQVKVDNTAYFWAGGRLSSDKRTLTWENGRSESIRKGQHPWSFTGSRGAQPDGSGSEDCLAVLNNFYNDGSKFHDVTCDHTKPTVCEA